MPSLHRPPSLLLLFFAGCCLLPSLLRAQATLYWQGGADGQWFNGTIWSDDNETPVSWSNGSIAWFNGNESVGNAGNAPLSLAGIRFGWSPGTLDTVTTLTSANLTLTGPALIAANDSVGRSRLNLHAPIAGTAGLTFAGPGTLWLNGASTYTGGTTLTRGTLIAAQSTAFSTGDITLAGEGNNTALRLDASVAGLTLANAVNVAAGTGPASIGSTAGTHATTFAGPLTLNRATTLIDGNTAVLGTSFTGAISGNVGTLSISGPRVILSGANTFTGGVSVSDSSILVLNSSAQGAQVLPLSSALELNNSGALVLHGHNAVGQLTGGSASSVQVRADQPSATLTVGTNNADSTFAGTLRDTGAGTVEGGPQLSLVKSGSGTLTLSGASTYTGGTTLSHGTLALGSAGALGTTGTLSFTGGTLQYSAANTTDYTPRFSNAANQLYRVDTNGRNVTFGTALTSTGGSFTKFGDGTLTLTANNTFTGATTVVGGTLILAPASGSALPTNAPLTIGPGATLQLDASGQLPTAAPTHVNGGTLHLNNVSSSTSQLTMTGGQVTASGASGLLSLLGTVTTHAADSTATISAPFLPWSPVNFNVARNAAAPNAVDLELSGSIAGFSSNSLTKTGEGTLLLSGNNAPYSGNISLTAGTLLVGSDSALGSAAITFHGAALGASGNRSLANFLAVGTAAARFDGADTLTLTGAVSDVSARGLVKDGTGTLVLAGTGNSFTGDTVIDTGTLRLGAANRLADTRTVTLANVAGATLDLNDHSETIGTLTGGGALGGHVDLGSGTLTITTTGSATFGGVISGTGGLTLTGGKPTLTLSGANTYTGTTLLAGGSLTLGASHVLADTSSLVVNTSGGNLNVGNFNDTVAAVSLLQGNITGSGILTSASTFDVRSGAVSARLGGSVGLTKTGAGTVILNGANTYTGVTTVSAGTLSLGNNNLLTAASTLLVNGGTFALNRHSQTVAGLTLQSGAITGTGNLTSTSTIQLESGTIDVSLNGSGIGLTKTTAGTATLTGPNTYTGATTINAGTLRVSGGAALADTAAVTLTANGGGTLELLSAETIGSLSGVTSDLSVNLNGANSRLTTGDAGNTTFAGIISGSGGLTKQGSGTLTLSGVNTFTGATFIDAGTLALTGASTLPSTAVVGLANTAGATLALSNAGATLRSIDGGGTTGGAVTLPGGTLTLTNANATRFDGIISGAGAVRITGGNFNPGGANTYSGGTELTGGTLTVGHDSALGTGALTIRGGTLASSGTRTLANAVSLASYFDVSGASDLTLAGAVTETGGSFGLFKTGTGNLTLAGSAANTFTGPVLITGGTLTLNKANNISNFAGPVIVGAGGTLAYAGFNQLAGADNTLTVNGGTFDMQGTGYRGFARSLYFRSGTITTSHASAGTPVQLNLSADTAGAFTVHGGLSTPASLTLALTGAFPTSGVTYDPSVNGGASTINGALLLAGGGGTFTVGDGSTASDLHVAGRLIEVGGARTVVKTGAGTLLLSGNNTYSGGTRLAAGGLMLGSNTALGSGTFTIDTGTVGAHGGARTVANAVTLAGDFTLAGTDTLAFSGATTLTGTRTVTSAAGSATTFSGALGQSGGAFGLTKAGDGTLTLAGTNTYTGATTVSAGTLNLSAAAGGSITGNLTVSAGATARVTHANQIADTSAISLNGGTLHLDNAVEGHGTGSLTLAGGHLTAAGTGRLDLGGTLTTLASASTSTIGAPVRLSAGSTFNVAAGTAPGGIDLDLTGAVGESTAGAVLTKTGVGTLRLGAAGSYSGSTTVSAGSLRLGAADVLPDTGTVTVASGATLHLGGHNEAVASLAGGGTVQTGGATLTVGVGHAGGTFAGSISGTGSLVKTGSGTLALTGTSDYTGGTAVNAGLVEFSSLAHLGSGTVTLNGGGVRWAAGATTDLSPRLAALGAAGATFDTNGNSVTLAGALSGATLTKTGGGVLTLSGVNSHAATTIAAGTLRLAGGAALADATTVTLANTAGATLDLNGTTETVAALAGGGNTGGNVTLGAGTLTLAAGSGSASYAGVLSGAGSLTKSGAGTQVLSGASTFSGGTTLSSGTLAVGSDSALGTGTLTLDGGQLRADGGARTLANAVVLNDDSTLGGSAALTLTGTLTLARTRDLTVTGSAVTTLTGSIGESGLGRGLAKYGDGELQLTAANTYTGGTFIGEGTVRINNTAGSAFGTGAVTVAVGATLTGTGSFTGALQLNGLYSPGNSPGTQATGSQTWAAGAGLVWEINDANGSAGTNWDFLNITGTLTLTTTAVDPFVIELVSLLGDNSAGPLANFDAAQDYSYTLATASGGITGFSADSFSVNTTGFANDLLGGAWSLAQAGNSLNLNFTAVPEPSTYALLAGACALGLAAWHRRRLRR